MPNIGDINIKIQGGTGAAASLGGMASSGGGQAGGAGFGGIGTQIGVMAGATLAILGILKLIFDSSKMLQRTFGRLMKLISLLLRPIGDMLSVLFEPLIMLIRPLALFINALFRPYILEARKAFRAGGKFLGMGMESKATESFFAGAEAMFIPIARLLVKVIGRGLEAGIDVFLAPVYGFIEIFKMIGLVSEDQATALEGSVGVIKDTLKGFVDDGINVADSALVAYGETVFTHIDDLSTLATNMSIANDTLGTMGGDDGLIMKLNDKFDKMPLPKAIAESTGFNTALGALSKTIALQKEDGDTIVGNTKGIFDAIYNYAASTKSRLESLLSQASASSRTVDAWDIMSKKLEGSGKLIVEDIPINVEGGI